MFSRYAPPRCIDRVRQARAAELRRKHDQRGAAVIEGINAELGNYHFYHRIEVVPGVFTNGHSWTPLYTNSFQQAAAQINFRDKRVLDVGCRDGAMLFMAEEGGARKLVGVDNDVSPGLVNFLIPFRRSRIQVLENNLYDLVPVKVGEFEIVICAGVLYHLRYPIWGLKKLSQLLSVNGILVLETAVIEEFWDMPLLYYPEGQSSPFEASSPSFPNLAFLKNACAMVGLMIFKSWCNSVHGNMISDSIIRSLLIDSLTYVI